MSDFGAIEIEIDIIEFKPDDEHGCVVLCHYRGQMIDMRIEQYSRRIKEQAKERGVSYSVLCDEINAELRSQRMNHDQL